MSKLSTKIYSLARKLNKTASRLNDAERIVKGDVSGLIKKKIRKETYKNTNKIARKINKIVK